MENAKQLRPIGQLLTDTWKTYKQNFKKISLLMLFGLIGIAPYLVLLAANFLIGPATLAIKSVYSLILFAAFIFLIYWILSTWIGLLIIIKNPEKKIIAAFNEGRKFFWGALAVTMIVDLFVGLWSCLFFVPGIIYMVFYSFAMFAFVYGGYRRSAALKRSKELVGGNWWPIFGRLLIAFVIMIVFSIIFSLPANISRPMSTYYYLYTVIGDTLSFVFIYPLFTVYLAHTYNDLVAAKPESSLPKEKDDRWLVVLASIFVVLAVLIIIALLGILIAYSVANGIN